MSKEQVIDVDTVKSMLVSKYPEFPGFINHTMAPTMCANVVSIVIDNIDINDILRRLDKYARTINKLEYGLPIDPENAELVNTDEIIDMRNIVSQSIQESISQLAIEYSQPTTS